jgi:hypothetical protein
VCVCVCVCVYPFAVDEQHIGLEVVEHVQWRYTLCGVLFGTS